MPKGDGIGGAGDLGRKVLKQAVPIPGGAGVVTHEGSLRCNKRTSLSDQTCALPPSTKSSIPVTKLESSEARNSAALATSSGSPMRPIGIVDTIRAITSEDCRFARGVLIGPGLTTFERIRRSFRSVVQVRTKERMAALLAA